MLDNGQRSMSGPPILPSRHTSDLLIGRVSIPGSYYFLTFCEASRQPGFADRPLALELLRALHELHASTELSLVAATVMPDHIHVLGRLGARLSLARSVGKFKARTRAALAAARLTWQENFYDHRLRSNDDLEPFARYIFLNPYRAQLIPLDEAWQLWLRWGDLRFQFESTIADSARVPAAWLGQPDPIGAADR
jgi:putative transposase